jgi:hypothetical protein
VGGAVFAEVGSKLLTWGLRIQMHNGVAINRIKAEMSKQKDALTRSILHALLAGQYRRYYAANRWQIDQRKHTGLTAGEKIEQWSSANFNRAILQSYEKALSIREMGC